MKDASLLKKIISTTGMLLLGGAAHPLAATASTLPCPPTQLIQTINAQISQKIFDSSYVPAPASDYKISADKLSAYPTIAAWLQQYDPNAYPVLALRLKIDTPFQENDPWSGYAHWISKVSPTHPSEAPNVTICCYTSTKITEPGTICLSSAA